MYKYTKKIPFTAIAIALVWHMSGCVYVYSKNIPYKTPPFSTVQLQCEPKESAPCEAVISAFQENNISILKKSEYTAKVATMYGKNESGGAYFVGGVYTSSNQAAEGMTGMSVSIYKGEQFLSRAAIDITEGTLSPDFAAKSVIKTLLNKKSESKTR